MYADSPQLGEVRNIFADIALVPDTNRYRNIISIAALEHIVDLPICVAKTGLLLKSGGRFLVGIPSEGGALWGAAWRLTTGLAFKLRTGLSYQTLMRHEHISDAQEILSIVKYFFSDVTVHRFPLPSHHFSLFAYIRAENPRLEKCGQYLLSTLPQGGFPE